jgi:hypothetical protein
MTTSMLLGWCPIGHAYSFCELELVFWVNALRIFKLLHAWRKRTPMSMSISSASVNPDNVCVIVELPHVHFQFFMWSCWCLSPFRACLFNRCYIIICLNFKALEDYVFGGIGMSKIDVLTLLRQHLFAFWICTPWSRIRTSVHRQLLWMNRKS